MHVVAATNRDLRVESAAGRFRSDLFYRLNVVDLRVPALRERREDIPYLTAAFVRASAARLKKTIVGLTPAAERVLIAAAWDGNVRELRNVIERAAFSRTASSSASATLRAGLSHDGVVVSSRPSRRRTLHVRRRLLLNAQICSPASSAITSLPCSRAPAATRPKPHGCSVSTGAVCTAASRPTPSGQTGNRRSVAAPLATPN